METTARRFRMRRGFTLIEILVAIAMIGLVTTFAVVRVDALLDGLGKPGLEDALDDAVRAARQATAEGKQVVWLSWDAELAAFRIDGTRGPVPVSSVPSAYGPRDGAVVTFLVTPPTPGRPESRAGTPPDPVEVKALAFSPDRSAPAFVAKLEEPGGTTEVRYDAFSPSRWPEGTP